MTSPSTLNTPASTSWADAVQDALEALGGTAHLDSIYDYVHTHREGLSDTWQATVRRTLQQHPLIVQDAVASGTWRLVTPDDLREELNLRGVDLDALRDPEDYESLVTQALRHLDCNAPERDIFAMVKKLRVATGHSTPNSFRTKVRTALQDGERFQQAPDDERVWQLLFPETVK